MGGARGREGDGRTAGDGADFPWLWLAPGLLVLLGLLIWGVLVYPDLPEQVPQHIGSDGVDRYADKSVGAVFLPLFVHAGTLALLAGTAYATLRITPQSELGPDQRVSSLVNRPKTREGARRGARAQLFLAFCLGLTLAVTCTVMWSTTPPEEGARLTWTLVLALLPVGLGTLAVLVTALRDRARGSGSQRPTSG
ncbi:DUF1648 domain-containing protein [Streptomyces oryzae]|uniref:DUF1648 domain-containing protein n=1 Tax=Streptomyces oryzae TaxID=1434886 RepID=A0ABS3X6W6_9ACTN|nr:DUF1648 domain-containing protein [Streptomyces oryzae]MBO8190821.1 DUF1648 domain-containing protein [Streptomyces oryzae]